MGNIRTYADIERFNKDLVRFYQAQETRLTMQLRKLNSDIASEAANINSAMAGSPEIKQALAQHGVPARIIEQCDYTSNKKGVVVEFPRISMIYEKGKRKAIKTPPFSKLSLNERAGVFKRVDDKIIARDQKILDNKA
jgi:hypothetical protein